MLQYLSRRCIFLEFFALGAENFLACGHPVASGKTVPEVDGHKVGGVG